MNRPENSSAEPSAEDTLVAHITGLVIGAVLILGLTSVAVIALGLLR